MHRDRSTKGLSKNTTNNLLPAPNLIFIWSLVLKHNLLPTDFQIENAWCNNFFLNHARLLRAGIAHIVSTEFKSVSSFNLINLWFRLLFNAEIAFSNSNMVQVNHSERVREDLRQRGLLYAAKKLINHLVVTLCPFVDEVF